MLGVSLEVPLVAFLIGGFVEGYDAASARVHVLDEALDRASFSGGVPSFKENYNAKAVLL